MIFPDWKESKQIYFLIGILEYKGTSWSQSKQYWDATCKHLSQKRCGPWSSPGATAIQTLHRFPGCGQRISLDKNWPCYIATLHNRFCAWCYEHDPLKSGGHLRFEAWEIRTKLQKLLRRPWFVRTTPCKWGMGRETQDAGLIEVS